MDTPMLTTKLFIPQTRSGLVARTRLIERLNNALSSGLTLVSASAGFGKTTAVVQWVLQTKKDTPVAWVSLDDGDNDPVRFWDYFIAALKTFKSAAGDAASTALHSVQSYSHEGVLTSLINDVADISKDFVVVLDDYHLIKSDAVHAELAFLLDHMPPRMHLVIVTRVDPPMPLPHFRGRGSLVEVGADDLRFTDEEAARLLKEILGAALSVEQVVSLNAHTEGWVGGLKMAALSMRGQKDIQSFISGFTGSQRYVMDYLVEEVMKRQTEEVRDFLLKTSVLERMTAPLCDFLTVDRRGREMLIELDRANLFLVPLDGTRQWYRYHHLFGELLRHQLETHYGVDTVAQLHQRASTWYENAGLLDDAIRHSLKARDFDTTTRLIGNLAGRLIGQGEWNTLFDWFQAIPEDVLRCHPAVYSQYANVLLTLGKLEAADSILDYLDRMTGAEEDLKGQLAFFQAIAAYRRGDMKRMIELGGRALAQLPPDSLAERARLNTMLGLFEWGSGALDRAWSRSGEIVEIGKRAGDYWTAANAGGMLSQIMWLRGRLRQAITVGQEAVELVGESPAAAFSRLILGYILYERNELKEAVLSSQLSIRLSETGGFAENRIAAYYCLAQALMAQREAGQAEEVMVGGDKAIRHPTVSPMCREIHISNRIMLAIQQNDMQAARDWGRQLSEYPLDTQWVWFQHAHPRLAIALGDYSRARKQLSRLYEIAVQADARGYIIRLRVFQMLAAPTETEALTFLTEALEIGEPEGYIRTFVDEGKLLKPLLRKALTQGITPEYTAKLLNIIETEEHLRQVQSGADNSGVSSGILSYRELEILRLVAAGLSNKQIADRLVISPGTAKRHVHNIFEKLNAGDRLHAINRARELKLI